MSSERSMIETGELDASGMRIPGENREVRWSSAENLRMRVLAAATAAGFDKVSAGVTLVHLGVELLRRNDPPVPLRGCETVLRDAVRRIYGRV